jgi:membrane protein YdbS with pleckstrin-like domain
MPQKLSSSVLVYWLVVDAVVVIALALIVGVALYFFGVDDVATGIATQADLGARLGLVFGGAVLIYLVRAAYRVIYFSLFSYTLGPAAVSIDSGVIIRSHKSVQFEEAQNVDVVRGPLLMLFGLGNLRVFTASPGQVVVVSTKNGTRTIHKPDVDIVLPFAEASSLSGSFTKAINRVVVTPPQA